MEVTPDNPLPLVSAQQSTSMQDAPSSSTQDSTRSEPVPPTPQQTTIIGAKFKTITQREKNSLDLRCNSRNANEYIQRETEMLEEEGRAVEQAPTVKPVRHQRAEKKPGKYPSEQARAFQEARYTKAGVLSMQALKQITVPAVFLNTRLVRSAQLNPRPKPKTEQQKRESELIEARSKRSMETWKKGGGSLARKAADKMVQTIAEDRKQRCWQTATGLKPTPAIRMTPEEMAMHAQRVANTRYMSWDVRLDHPPNRDRSSRSSRTPKRRNDHQVEVRRSTSPEPASTSCSTPARTPAELVSRQTALQTLHDRS